MVNLYIVAGRQSPESQKPGFFFCALNLYRR